MGGKNAPTIFEKKMIEQGTAEIAMSAAERKKLFPDSDHQRRRRFTLALQGKA